MLEAYLSSVRENQRILEAELLALEVRGWKEAQPGWAGGRKSMLANVREGGGLQ